MSCKSHWNSFSTYSWDLNLRVETALAHAIRGENEGRRITTLLPSCYFWIWLAFLPLHTPSFFPSPHLLHALQAHTNTLTYSEAQARATVGLKPEDLNSASSLPAGFVLWNQSELGRTSSLLIVSGWNLATWLSINFFLCYSANYADFRAAKLRAGDSQEKKDPETISYQLLCWGVGVHLFHNGKCQP